MSELELQIAMLKFDLERLFEELWTCLERNRAILEPDSMKFVR